MRKLFIAGNWKMNLETASARDLAESLAARIEGTEDAATVDILVCPPSIYLNRVIKALADSPIGVGAQNVYFEGNGAFTGEISVEMLNDIRCPYVIIGHSERRHVMGETDELINKKLLAALAGGIVPLLCIGELLSERESTQTNAVVERQLRKGLDAVSADQMKSVTIAYEPVWAIGTGKTATADQAQEVHAFIREVLAEMYSDSLAQEIRIQYGGSVKPDNACELMSNPDVDGVLVGGASLKADDFIAIIEGGIQSRTAAI